MPMSTEHAARVRTFAPIVLPLLAIAAARSASYSDWAAANATLAALLLLWIAADSLALGVLAKAADNRPGLYPMLGAIAVGCIVATVGAAPPVREALLAMEPLVAAMALTVAAFLLWSAARFVGAWRNAGSLEAAYEAVFPAPLVRFARIESRMMRIGLLSWNAAPDVPAGARAFSYHRYLTPMLATFVALQLIELAVVHFLVSLWNETVALVLLALSVWGTIWLVALMKSFRLYPVLMDSRGIRVRSGALVDVDVPFAAIAGTAPMFDRDTLDAKDTLNTAILSSPNVCLDLAHPIAIPTFFGGSREIRRVAMRLEDSAGFLALFGERE